MIDTWVRSWPSATVRSPGSCGRVLEPAAALIPGDLPRRSRLAQAKRFVEAAGRPPADRYLRWVGYFTHEQKRTLNTADFRAALDDRTAVSWFADLFAGPGGDIGPLDRTLAVDVNSYLPYDLLVKMDIATMANSLEARSPLLDHKFMEFAARLPESLKVRGRTTKYLLKRYAETLLPRQALHRRKMGFGVPVGDWLKNELKPLVEDCLRSDRAAGRAYLNPDAIRQLVAQHRAGTHDHSQRLWALLWLELWFREFIH
jgi:asparagine synthase (glutamine-hydrolysing)